MKINKLARGFFIPTQNFPETSATKPGPLAFILIGIIINIFFSHWIREILSGGYIPVELKGVSLSIRNIINYSVFHKL